MKTRTTLASLVVFLAGVVYGLAQTDASAFMGTWKLNEAKSKFPPGAIKNTMVTYTAAGDNMVKIVTDGTDKDGKPNHSEWTGKLDGKDYPVTGTSTHSARSYILAGKHSLSFTVKQGDKTIETGKVTVAPDGKSRTVTTTGSDPSMNTESVYDKQ